MFTQQTREQTIHADANNNYCDQGSLASMDSQPYTNGSNDLFTNWKNVKYSRDIVLKQMYQSLSVSKGGLQECIENALGFHPEGDSTTTTKEFFQFGEERNKYPAMTHWMFNGTKNAAKGQMGLEPRGLVTQSNYHNNTELCKRAFFDILMSENFIELSNLILQNFDGVKVDRVFDFSSIDLKMKAGAYECSPELFNSDVQQVWTKLEKVGTELVTLARSLKSRTSYSEQMGGSVHGTSYDSKFEQYPTQESTAHLRPEIFTGAGKKSEADRIQTDKETIQEINTSIGSNETGNLPHCSICRHEVKNHEEAIICGNFSCPGKYCHTSCLTSKQLDSYGPCWYCPSCICQTCLFDRDDDKIILCDGCDQGFHIYCTRPPLDSIPVGKWFCTNCQDRINNIRKARRAYLRKQKKESQREKNLIGIQTNVGSNLQQCCHICRQEVGNYEEVKICGNFLCPRKYYHNRCLSSTQLDSYGLCWFCPSCLCQVCLSDRDDDKVILCDECDHGYHIYCVRPPLGLVPEGKWSCPKCVEARECVRKPKRRYRRKQRVVVEREANYEVVDDCGGVDMLLAAAKTVNLEESLASLAMNS